MRCHMQKSENTTTEIKLAPTDFLLRPTVFAEHGRQKKRRENNNEK